MGDRSNHHQTSRPPGWYSRGYHHHFDGDGAVQFITFRLADSIPKELYEQWQGELTDADSQGLRPKLRISQLKRISRYEDLGRGACHLGDHRIAKVMLHALQFANGKHYDLIAWCIMPNHVHVLIEMFTGFYMRDIVRSWKSYTAHQANKILGRTGMFWGKDYFDRYIRDSDHFNNTVFYIMENPVKAGLVKMASQWPWSGNTVNFNADGDVRAPKTRL